MAVAPQIDETSLTASWGRWSVTLPASRLGHDLSG